MRKFILEIKAPHSYRTPGYGRFATPVIKTWRWRQIAICETKEPLIEIANRLSLMIFFDRRREYQIV